MLQKLKRFHTLERDARLTQFWFLVDLLALCVVIAVLIGGVIVRERLPLIPLADGDTWGYLQPALSWLSGFGFQDTERDWLYPALLGGIIKISGDFCAITYVQRLLGLAGILCFWLTWRSFLRLLPTQKPAARLACSVLMLWLLSLYALSSQQALLENRIRPEGVLAFFEMVYFYCLINFLLSRWRWRRTGSAIVYGALTLGFSYAILLLKPSWGFSLGFTFLFLVAGALGRATRLLRFGPVLGGAAASLLLFFFPNILGFQKAPQLFLPSTLVCIHAEEIVRTSPGEGSSTALNSSAPNQMFYEELAKAYGKAKENPNCYDALGFDTDYIQYHSDFFSIVTHKEGWTKRELASVCYSAYFRAWHQAPLEMLNKVWKQLGLFIFPRHGDFYAGSNWIELNHELIISRSFLPDSQFSPEVRQIYLSYLRSLQEPESKPSPPNKFKILDWSARYVAWTSFWLQVAFFAAIISICLRRNGKALRLGGFAVFAVLAATYGNVLTIALVHSLDVSRYRISYAPGFLLGLAMIANYLLIIASGRSDSCEEDGEYKLSEANSVLASRSHRL